MLPRLIRPCNTSIMRAGNHYQAQFVAKVKKIWLKCSAGKQKLFFYLQLHTCVMIQRNEKEFHIVCIFSHSILFLLMISSQPTQWFHPSHPSIPSIHTNCKLRCDIRLRWHYLSDICNQTKDKGNKLNLQNIKILPRYSPANNLSWMDQLFRLRRMRNGDGCQKTHQKLTQGCQNWCTAHTFLNFQAWPQNAGLVTLSEICICQWRKVRNAHKCKILYIKDKATNL